MSNLHSREYPKRQSKQYQDVEEFKGHERRLCNMYEIAIRTKDVQQIAFDFRLKLKDLLTYDGLSFQGFVEETNPIMIKLNKYNLHPYRLHLNYSFLPDHIKEIPEAVNEFKKMFPDNDPDEPRNKLLVSLVESGTQLLSIINIETLIDHQNYNFNGAKRYDELGCMMIEMINPSLTSGKVTYGGASTNYTFPYFSRPVMLDTSNEKRTMLEINFGLTLEENIALLRTIYKNKGVIPGDTGLSIIGLEMESHDSSIETPRKFADALFVYDYYMAAVANDHHDKEDARIRSERDKVIEQIKSDETISPLNKKEMISKLKRQAANDIRNIDERLIETIRDLVLPDLTTKAIRTTYLNKVKKLIDDFKTPEYIYAKKDNFSSFHLE